jgi:hypothetical protein
MLTFINSSIVTPMYPPLLSLVYIWSMDILNHEYSPAWRDRTFQYGPAKTLCYGMIGKCVKPLGVPQLC